MSVNRKEVGKTYEKLAAEYLKEKGYQILEYNYRTRYAEIDMIACKENVLVFCEVKFRKLEDRNAPLEAVTFQKQRKISKAALHYLTTRQLLDMECRFDVIGISGKKVTHIKNAFDYIGV